MGTVDAVKFAVITGFVGVLFSVVGIVVAEPLVRQGQSMNAGSKIGEAGILTTYLEVIVKWIPLVIVGGAIPVGLALLYRVQRRKGRRRGGL